MQAHALLRPAIFLLLPSFLAGGAALAQKTADWPAYNGGLNGDHYSRLSQITKSNVAKLRQAWVYDTGEKGGIQTNPLIVAGTLYGFTPTQKVIALDAATGQVKWKFDSGIEGSQPSRGLSWWTDGHESRLFAGVMNFLYCLDPATGKPIAGFGQNGRIDLRKGLRDPYQDQSVALTAPGVIWKDTIIVGGRNPETHPAPPGDLRAFDIHTGAVRWVFHTIPRPGEPGYETWPKDAWKDAGAANNWAGMTLDAQHGILFVPTGSAVFDFYGGDRIGDDLYANCLLALDANTGKLLWHFQGVHHDIWDRDFPSPPALYTVKKDGRTIDAIAQTSKQGYLYLFDRLTGKPLYPITEKPYPASTLSGEVASKTQPLPEYPEPFARQRLTEDLLTTRTPAAHAWALKEFQDHIHSDGQFIPFSTDKMTVVFPGFDGGAEWGGPAVDPVHNILYVNANEMTWLGQLAPAQQGGSAGAQLYRDQCAVCHGIERAGSPPSFPSLVDIDKRIPDDQIAATVHGGKGRMPSFPNVDGDRLKDLVAYLHTPAATSGDKKEMQSDAAQPAPKAHEEDPAGAKVYAKKCAVCHGSQREGNAPAFPALLGVGNRMTSQQVGDLVHNGKGRMPGQPGLQSPDIEALLKYLGVGEESSSGDSAATAHTYVFSGYRKFLDPDGYPAFNPPWGTLNAIDLNTGKYLWKISLGEFPELVAKGMKNTGSENYGGPIVTASGVLFIGATDHDRKFRAFDAATGKLLWETILPYLGNATPATYMIGGKQYVVIGASGARDPNTPQGSAWIAFSLP
ncbi:MAG TPA: c-type cytochrome [Terracidiphilus sp.]|jgi:glucose dehydrogenase